MKRNDKTFTMNGSKTNLGLSQVLVDWAMIEHWRVMSDCRAPDMQMVVARMLALKQLQRECGHDGMKQVIAGGDLWHCQACGGLQRASEPNGLKMPGTYVDAVPSEALGVELAAWSAPGHHHDP